VVKARRNSRQRLHADSLNIFFTLVALGLELAAARMMSGDYKLYQFQCVRMSSIVIVGLYTFELIFRFDMRPPL
jgi:O-antigen/teichoic acid export membrane protein